MFEFRWNFAYHLNDTSVFDVAARSRRTPPLTWPPTSVAVSHFDFSLCCGQLVLSSARGGLPLAGTERGEGAASQLPPTKSGGKGGLHWALRRHTHGSGLFHQRQETHRSRGASKKGSKTQKAAEITLEESKAEKEQEKMKTVMRCLSQPGDGKDPNARTPLRGGTLNELWQTSPERRPPRSPYAP